MLASTPSDFHYMYACKIRKIGIPVGTLVLAESSPLFSRFTMPRCFALLACFLAASSAAYDPTWESLDQRTAPEWFLQEKFYIFVQYVQFTVRQPVLLFTPTYTFSFLLLRR